MINFTVLRIISFRADPVKILHYHATCICISGLMLCSILHYRKWSKTLTNFYEIWGVMLCHINITCNIGAKTLQDQTCFAKIKNQLKRLCPHSIIGLFYLHIGIISDASICLPLLFILPRTKTVQNGASNSFGLFITTVRL